MKRAFLAGVRLKLFTGLLLAAPAVLMISPNAEAKCVTSDISVHCGQAPTAAYDKSGRLWVVFVQKDDIYVAARAADHEGYSSAVKVTTVPEKVFVNGENRPKIVFGPGNEMYLSWTKVTGEKFDGDVRFSRSLDGGKTFSAPMTINDDKQVTGHRFDKMVVANNGDIYLAWIDQRDRVEAEKEDKSYRGAAIYTAVSKDRGATFEPNRKLADNSCECCRLAGVAQPEQGVVFLWRHIFKRNTRDHAMAWLDGLQETEAGDTEKNGAKKESTNKYSAKKDSAKKEEVSSTFQRVTFNNWQIDGCPHHGPHLAAGRDASLHMTWFTGGSKPGIYYGQRMSADEDAKWVQRLTEESSAAHPQVRELDGQLVVVWKQFNGEATTLVARWSIDGGKTWSEQENIVATNGGSDHPQVISNQRELVVAWQTTNEGLLILPLRQPDKETSDSPKPHGPKTEKI